MQAQLNKITLIIRAINHDLRYSIIEYLIEEKQSMVSNIIAYTGQDQSTVSQHLAILRRAGLVDTQRSGRFIYYSVNKDTYGYVKGITSNLESSSIF